jgi:hypothetical protein
MSDHNHPQDAPQSHEPARLDHEQPQTRADDQGRAVVADRPRQT